MDDAAGDARLAVIAATLYLLNLTLLPVVAFVALLWLWGRRRAAAGAVARSHLDSALRGSVLAGVLLVLVGIAVLVLGGPGRPGTWVVLVLYVTTVHAALVLTGVVALVRALAGQSFRFPLVGARHDG